MYKAIKLLPLFLPLDLFEMIWMVNSLRRVELFNFVSLYFIFMQRLGRVVVGEVDIFSANKFFPVISSTTIVNFFFFLFEPHRNHSTLCLFGGKCFMKLQI